MTAPSPPPPHPARIPSAPPASAVWGRGALDIKFNVAALLETLSLLIQDGFVPQRTIYVTFGHDEEVGVLRYRGIGAEGRGDVIPMGTLWSMAEQQSVHPYDTRGCAGSQSTAVHCPATLQHGERYQRPLHSAYTVTTQSQGTHPLAA